ncbi:MAG: hypothetical protein JSU92_12985 [Deltaproteobacteria bacterium]|nr:MAG: hypothetical protein JSU92_12985 [Deltaproteobacteria bacterium]
MKNLGGQMGSYLRTVPILGMIILSSCSNNMLVERSPLVYSFDGKEYQLEAELYPGARFEAGERTDYIMLGQLSPVNDEYRLRIVSGPTKNYVNELKLLIVDRPAGMELLPGEDGRLYTLSSPAEPRIALDKKLNDLLSLVRQSDDKSWGEPSHPLSLLTKSPDWDWMDLSFERPRSLPRVKLIIEAVNTLRASLMERDYLAERGYRSEKELKKMGELPGEFEDFQKWREENLTLQIMLWNGDTWELMAKAQPVGSRAVRKLVFPLNAGEAGGEYIKLRLKTTSLVWRIDRVAIDYSPQRDIAVREARLIEARSSSGNRLEGLLRRKDTKYYVATEGESAELVFRAVPEKKGSERSCLIKINGYYQARFPGPGEDIRDELDQLLKKFFDQG